MSFARPRLEFIVCASAGMPTASNAVEKANLFTKECNAPNKSIHHIQRIGACE
jgi:hypothetical protein